MKNQFQLLAFYVLAAMALSYSIGFGFTLAIIASEHATAVFSFLTGL